MELRLNVTTVEVVNGKENNFSYLYKKKMKKPEVVGMISKLLFRLHLYLREKFDPRYPITEEETYIGQICSKLIESPQSNLNMSPISKKRFIKNSDKDIFIIIDNRQVTLIKSSYGYNIFIENDDLFDEITKKFDNELETRRINLENEMRKNVRNSLQIILEKINQS